MSPRKRAWESSMTPQSRGARTLSFVSPHVKAPVSYVGAGQIKTCPNGQPVSDQAYHDIRTLSQHVCNHCTILTGGLEVVNAIT